MNKIIGVSAVLFLTGCAGSASHQVVRSDPVADQGLSCQQADAEISRSQGIINAVNDDKSSISGADVMDGVLWFPFNLVAKAANYNNALTAANQRILGLKELKREKGCPENVELQTAQTELITAKLKEINDLYSEGAITQDEYKNLKLKAMGLTEGSEVAKKE